MDYQIRLVFAGNSRALPEFKSFRSSTITKGTIVLDEITGPVEFSIVIWGWRTIMGYGFIKNAT